MDSDSSLDEERNRWSKQDVVPIPPNMNDENSDVSDEENISRAARSIESPPESPQGTHFESPPASPDPENKPGTPSPIQSPEDSASYGSPLRSPDSQMDSRQVKNESPPRSPDSYLPRSPSPVRFSNRSPPSNPGSPGPIKSPSYNQSLRNKSSHFIQSPEPPRSPRSPNSIQSPTPVSQDGIQSPSQRSESPNSVRSPSPYRQSSPHRSRRRGSESPDRSQSPLLQRSSPRFKGRRSPSQSPPRQQSGRNSRLSDDGRSNISSASSFSSPHNSPPRPRSPPRARTPPKSSAPLRVKTVAELKSHVEDLSDVSDVDSLNSMSEDEADKPQQKENGDIRVTSSDVRKDLSLLRNSTGGLEADDSEQLDFEAEEKEEGECEGPPPPPKPTAPATEAVASEDEGELKGDELEEGEITDEGENRPEETEPRPICRFYNRGQCTWGSSCRFVHPGVTDKGNYTMFEMVRPLVPVNGPPPPIPPMYGPPPMVDPYRPPIERPMMGPPPPMYQQPPPPRKEEVPPVVESAWERGLRQAKEMLRKSSKRKETEVDFEEKKMNLSIGQDELDKENDYYTRTASPILMEDGDRWGGKMEGESKRYRSERYDEFAGEGAYYSRSTEQVWHQRPHYDESMRGVYTSSRSSSKYYPSHSRTSREKEYYTSTSSSTKKQKYSQREVIVQRPEKTSSWKDDSPPARPSRYAEPRSSGGRGDEWADPWMRSKTSPLSRKRTRKQSYSSGSSYSSSSSSRSSRSSSSSYSRSRSQSHSSRSRSRDKASKMSPPRRLLRVTSPLTRSLKLGITPALMQEKKVPAERSIMMNPPPPSPRSKAKSMAANPSPPIERIRPGAGAGVGVGVPARLLGSKAASAVAAAMRSARSGSKSSHSSSNSDSSGSSSDSSESSFSSSSSIRQKRIVIDERLALAQAMKVKAMDALKLSGQKQQIKLTLKGTSAGERMPMASLAGKKRPAESPPLDFSPPKVGGKTTPKKAAPSRREELLKQLKAVEDAIARKRSKIS